MVQYRFIRDSSHCKNYNMTTSSFSILTVSITTVTRRVLSRIKLVYLFNLSCKLANIYGVIIQIKKKNVNRIDDCLVGDLWITLTIFVLDFSVQERILTKFLKYKGQFKRHHKYIPRLWFYATFMRSVVPYSRNIRNLHKCRKLFTGVSFNFSHVFLCSTLSTKPKLKIISVYELRTIKYLLV